jgi:hypothetical protein
METAGSGPTFDVRKSVTSGRLAVVASDTEVWFSRTPFAGARATAEAFENV